MTTYLPTLKQLQYLVALEEHGHFGRAAEACFVTQSTLSAGIKELETLLDVILVERTRRLVRFSPLGLKVVAKAHRILREAEELTEMTRASGKPLAGELRMSVIPTIAPFVLPSLLPQLRLERPELQLMLREETSAAACDSLHHGQVDCILLAKPFACGDVESAKICDDAILIAFPKDDPRDPPAIIDPAMIDEHRLLLLEDGHCLKDHALAACNRPELRASATMMATSLHTLVQLVNNGLGLTMIPQMAIDAGIIGTLNIAVRPLKSPHASREIALLWRRNSPRREEFLLLADIIRRHAVSRSAG